MFRVAASVARFAVRPSAPLAVSARDFGSKAGVVKFFNGEKGFGFIESDGQDYFVHHTGIEGQGFRSLADGESVEFDAETDDRGKQRAVRVTGPGGAAVKGAPRKERQDGGRY
jgi:cold shock CspA family protein